MKKQLGLLFQKSYLDTFFPNTNAKPLQFYIKYAYNRSIFWRISE